MSEIHALSGAYAVDALDDIERALFERHLAECAECRAEVRSLRETAALLADDAQTTPPPSLRAGVLAGISTVRPLPPEVGLIVPVRRRWLPLLVAACLAMVALGSIAWHPWSTGPGRLSVADQVLQAADARSVTQELPGGATATVTVSATLGRAVVTTSHMPPPPGDSVYELWLQRPDGSMAPAGLMPVKADQTVLLDGDSTGAVGAGITVEPAGGSPQPTTSPIALFDFSRAG